MRVRTLLGPLVLVGVVAIVRHRSRVDPLDLWVDEAAAATQVPTAAPSGPARHGSRSERGRGGSVRIDVARARAHHVEPVVEFLTYVQRRRGDEGHLLFVRTEDLDAMAEAADEPVDAFLSRLDQLGVVVSHN